MFALMATHSGHYPVSVGFFMCEWPPSTWHKQISGILVENTLTFMASREC